MYLNNLVNNKLLLFLLFIFLLLQIPLIDIFPGIMVDESWYANTAWNYSIGNSTINTVPGGGGGDDLFLYTVLLGTIFQIFGTSLAIGRLFSVFCGLFSLIGYFKILKILDIKNNIIVFVCVLMFIFSNVNYVIFRSVRPESLVVLLAIWSIYFLIKGHKNNNINFLFTSLLSSMAFLCHPHGLLYVFLFGLLLSIYSYKNNNMMSICYYIIGLVPAFILFFTYILFIKDVSLLTFFDSWINRLSVDESNFIYSQFNNIKSFISTYCLGFKRLYIFIFEIGTLIVGLFFYKKDKYIFIASLIGILYFFISLVVLYPFSTRHFSEVLIFSLIVFGLLMNFYNNKIYYKKLLIIGLIYLVNNITGDFYVIFKNYNNTSYNLIDREIDSIIPNKNKVLSLLNFWFPLKNNESYNSYSRLLDSKYKDIDTLIKSGEIKYIVISDYMINSGTSTSGRKADSNVIDQLSKYYKITIKYARNSGKLINSIDTKGYGNIQIWEIY